MTQLIKEHGTRCVFVARAVYVSYRAEIKKSQPVIRGIPHQDVWGGGKELQEATCVATIPRFGMLLKGHVPAGICLRLATSFGVVLN